MMVSSLVIVHQPFLVMPSRAHSLQTPDVSNFHFWWLRGYQSLRTPYSLGNRVRLFLFFCVTVPSTNPYFHTFSNSPRKKSGGTDLSGKSFTQLRCIWGVFPNPKFPNWVIFHSKTWGCMNSSPNFKISGSLELTALSADGSTKVDPTWPANRMALVFLGNVCRPTFYFSRGTKIWETPLKWKGMK